MLAYRLIVFDMDGVLVDSGGCHARAYRELWKRIGLDNPPRYSHIAGRRTVQVVRDFTAGLGPSEAQLAEWVGYKQQLARQYLDGIEPFPDVVPSLERLQAVGTRFALATGASRVSTERVLRLTGLDDYFPVRVTADDVARGKPEPDAFLQAMELAGGIQATTLVVEDSAAGLLAGAAAGAATASVRQGQQLNHLRFLGCFPDVATLTDELLTARRAT